MKVAGKLTALLGLPLLALFSIFASGVYCGATRADRVVGLEQRWLGIEPPPGRVLDRPEADGADPEAAEPGDAPEPGTPEPAQPPKPEQPEQAQPEPAQPQQPDQPAQPEPAQPQPQSEHAGGLAIATAAPVGPELRELFDQVRVVDVQIMVDPALVVAREDWLTYVAELFEATRASYEVLFGIRLQLHGVVVWDPAAEADADTLLAELGARPHDGAEILLGLVASERPPGFAAPTWTGERTGDHALVFADLQQRDRYYRNMLRALAVLFGAEPTSDPAAKQLGSFMSDAAAPAGAAPVLDPANRGRVIIHKRREFAEPERRSQANPDAPGDQGEDG